ncbi:MAG TPA: hypothetical protein VLM18_12435 [Croceibacterium sp.]|nr:hypothetical protein [Croceibacterium sp.]
MLKTIIAAALLAGIATPALAQRDFPPPSSYAPQPDKPTCTMDQLKAATAAYVAGQAKGDISALPLDPKAHYLQDMATVEKSAGLWNTALPVAHAMSLHDPLRCKTFSEIVVTQGGHPYVIGTRLYLNAGKVIRVDSLVTKPGDWLFNANAYLKYVSAENWQLLTKYQHTPPAEMIRGANAYLDAFADKFTDVPWGQPCARLEGGAYTNRDAKRDASCEVGIPAGTLYIVNRDYLVDPEMGVINVFCRFGSSTGGPDSHSFRFIDGKIRGVHTISVLPGPQSDDNGAILRPPAPPES